MSSPKNNSNRLVIIVASVLVLMALAVWLWPRKTETITSVETPTVSAITNAGASAIFPATPVAPVITTGSLQKIYSALQTAADAAAARKQLAELRATLSAMPTNEAVAAIRQFLDSKADASTQLGFKIGSDGQLDEAPTLRTFLLDELARIDPTAAADYAKVILASMDSPDEWAVALRNLARGDTSSEGHDLLAQKTAALLQNGSWQQNPSAGFLEAFDVAVYLGGNGLMPALTDLIRQPDNPAVAHASFLALDRLVINDPTTTLNALLADTDSMQGREQARADFFARANVQDPQQRQILENYLLNPKTTPAEIDAFTGIFPNANFMISPNLLTQSPTMDRATLASRDAASLRVAQEWLADPRFAQLRPELQKTITRLQEFVRQANEGR